MSIPSWDTADSSVHATCHPGSSPHRRPGRVDISASSWSKSDPPSKSTVEAPAPGVAAPADSIGCQPPSRPTDGPSLCRRIPAIRSREITPAFRNREEIVMRELCQKDSPRQNLCAASPSQPCQERPDLALVLPLVHQYGDGGPLVQAKAESVSSRTFSISPCSAANFVGSAVLMPRPGTRGRRWSSRSVPESSASCSLRSAPASGGRSRH
jgi:hypothetical protein